VWDRSWITPWVWPLIGLYNIGLGAVLLAGGPDRINGPSFAVIREIGYVPTGLAFLVMGIAVFGAAIIGRIALLRVGVLLGVLHILLASGFLAALLSEPPPQPSTVRAALTGVPTYLFVAAVHFANAFVYGRRGPLGGGSG
jgi:hypothetical protein